MSGPGEDLTNIARQAERDLNTYQAKIGAHKTSPSDEAGVDTRAEQKFPGAEVRYDQDLSTNASYNKRIPPEEGGDLDARGRSTRGEHFEGIGGPEDKVAQQSREFGGYEDIHIPGARNRAAGESGATDTSVPYSKNGRDPLPEGRAAVSSNIEGTKYDPAKEHFKGEDWYRPEEVPDSIAAQGNVPPESATQAPREA